MRLLLTCFMLALSAAGLAACAANHNDHNQNCAEGNMNPSCHYNN